MRILLIADIHGNWPALQAITEPHDVCIFLGDLVDYGLEPAPCIDWVRKRARYAIRGNHDHDTAQNVTVVRPTGFRYLTAVTRPISRRKLSAADLRFLADLPVSQWLTLDGLRYLLVHGSPRDPLDEYNRPEVDFWAPRLEGVEADVICVGHTHQPYILEVGDKLVINPGSVGQPRDGDPRAAYALIDNRQVELKRVDYPIDAVIRTIQSSPLPDLAKEALIDIHRSGGRNRDKKPAADAS